MQYAREALQEAAARGSAIGSASVEIEEEDGSSSSSSNDILTEQDNDPPSDNETGESVANKATQVRPQVKSKKSQAALGECLKCAERKLEIRKLQKQNSRLRSHVGCPYFNLILVRRFKY